LVVVDLDARSDSGTTLPQLGPETHFNLIYTSGSTGVPKGVVQNHLNVLFDARATTSVFPISSRDTFGLVIPLTFGASVSDVAGALLNGASLELFDLKTLGMDVMARWMAERRISITHLVPTVLRRWLSAPIETGYPDMRLIKAGGEPLLRSDFELFKSAPFPADCRLRNGLGTTETYLIADAIYGPSDEVEDPVVPVGTPAAGRAVTGVDEEGREVPRGTVGQIEVTSAYLSPGYWNAPESTTAAFRSESGTGQVRTYTTGDLGRIRDDGQLEHLGRVDDMVKVMGRRVHLSEIETRLLDISGVREAAVVPATADGGDVRLIAYVVADDDFAGSAAARSSLHEILPSHMVPVHISRLESLPTLPFGKVDRRALAALEPDLEDNRADYRAPADEIESVLASTAANVLGIEKVGVDDDLFDLGLDSLSAVQLVTRARSSLEAGLAIEMVFEHSTVAALAETIRSAEKARPAGDIESILSEIEELGEQGARSMLGLAQQ
jgi:acyl-coenzyme A synthetase/AMP-(fatty) acid ligase/acyl carrier protein